MAMDANGSDDNYALMTFRRSKKFRNATTVEVSQTFSQTRKKVQAVSKPLPLSDQPNNP